MTYVLRFSQTGHDVDELFRKARSVVDGVRGDREYTFRRFDIHATNVNAVGDPVLWKADIEVGVE